VAVLKALILEARQIAPIPQMVFVSRALLLRANTLTLPPRLFN
jgi:hypothetical protein